MRSLHHEHLAYNDIVGFYFGALTVLYGITLGLLMVGVRSIFSDTDQKVSRKRLHCRRCITTSVIIQNRFAASSREA